ncbi:YwhD family protein [Alicyclobacillus sp. SO9]|uniref:YwhD family protein n=1 Tax=Alicyclobacillus sp. SO9 TaxID=2665646 RepID=UPI0018E8DAA5|nr:YwhD family protein [Alicyclobacillus sp. SO9]QQE80373.1 YwhD family protein [Alicyclobacillus sp. SO9]
MKELKLTGKKTHSTDDQMRGLSAVLVDGTDVFVDNGAIHAKSRLEKGIKFVKEKAELKNPREIWVFWLTIGRVEGSEKGYKAVQGYPMYIDEEASLGYKSMADSVNSMDRVVRGSVDVSNVPREILARLKNFLKSRETLWEHAKTELQEVLDA